LFLSFMWSQRWGFAFLLRVAVVFLPPPCSPHCWYRNSFPPGCFFFLPVPRPSLFPFSLWVCTQQLPPFFVNSVLISLAVVVVSRARSFFLLFRGTVFVLVPRPPPPPLRFTVLALCNFACVRTRLVTGPCPPPPPYDFPGPLAPFETLPSALSSRIFALLSLTAQALTPFFYVPVRRLLLPSSHFFSTPVPLYSWFGFAVRLWLSAPACSPLPPSFFFLQPFSPRRPSPGHFSFPPFIIASPF